MMDAELDKKKADLEYKQAKRQRTLAIFNAIIGTAQAVINAANTQPFFPLGLAMMAVAGVAGALQIATISRQPLPARGYEEGLYPEYTKREQDGKLFRTGRPKPMRSGLYRKSTILVGEGPGDQPEMVIDKKTFARISPSVQEALIREIQGIKGFEKGFYDNAGVLQVPATPTPSAPSQDNTGMLMMAEALNRNSAILEKIDRDGILAKVLANDYKSLENLKEGMDKYNELKSKSRR
jgi:tubulin-specific chaperone A